MNVRLGALESLAREPTELVMASFCLIMMDKPALWVTPALFDGRDAP